MPDTFDSTRRPTAAILAEKVRELAAAANAVILAHNYQLGEVQDVADFVGDSLELSFKAAEAQAEVIVFCGVTFMAETAAILAPGKTVLLPVLEAGCPMADMAEAADVEAMKRRHPDALVVTYVNSSVAVKAVSDICVTSANALAIVNSLPQGSPIIFVPDANLGAYAASQTGRQLILWDGFCPTHMRIAPEHLRRRRQEFPNAKVIAHPECPPDVIELADQALSTGGMIKFARETDAKQIIVATEVGLIHRLEKENPDKQFIPVSEQAVCPNMKLTRLEDVANALEKRQHVISVPADTAAKARIPIERMLRGSM